MFDTFLIGNWSTQTSKFSVSDGPYHRSLGLSISVTAVLPKRRGFPNTRT